MESHTPAPVVPAPARDKPPLLFLCHRIPYPPDKGDKIRSFHLLRYLSRHFDIHLAGFVDDERDWAWVPEVETYCRTCFFRPLRSAGARLRSLGGLFRGTALSLPYYADDALARWVDATCRYNQVRHALVYSSTMAQFLPDDHLFQRRIIDFVDVDSDKWRQYAGRKHWPMSQVYRREHRNLLRWEQDLAARFDASLFVSAPEAALFRQLTPDAAGKIGFYNNGVDSSYFDPASPAVQGSASPFPAGCRTLVFTGAMDYWPNVDAVTWFAHEVFPALRARDKHLLFCIVGGNPPGNVRRLDRLPGVAVTGRVPDVRPYLHHGFAAVAPMRVARGVQNKVLEGMAMELPVLVSRKGLEGIEASHEQQVLLADHPEDFRRAIDELVAGQHPNLGTRARTLVLEHFNWDKNLPRVLDLLRPETALARAPESRHA